MKYNCFNSRSREGSDYSFVRAHCSRLFQFTLPRGERLRLVLFERLLLLVSIHAPARGATT